MKKIIKITALIVFLLPGLMVSGQNNGVSISADNSQPDASAILDVKSATQGVLFPRISSAQRDEIETPAAGLIIYNTSRKCIEYFTGISWESAVPAGTIQPYGGSSSEVPDGWMLCNGTAISREEFKDLYQAIGIRFGAGNNQTTFNLPDLRGMFLRGANNGRTDEFKDPDAENRNPNGLGIMDDAGSTQIREIQSHRHTSPPGTHYINPNGNNTYTGYIDKPIVTSGAVAGGTPPSITWTEYKGGNETRPNNIYVNYIIKY